MSKNIFDTASSLLGWVFVAGLLVLALFFCVLGTGGFVRCLASRNYIGIVAGVIFFTLGAEILFVMGKGFWNLRNDSKKTKVENESGEIMRNKR